MEYKLVKKPTNIGYEYIKNQNGTEYWYLNGKWHREGGPAKKYPNRNEVWYLNGKRHREDGPALKHSDGTEMWLLNGEYHRPDGPAVKYPNGEEYWYLEGTELEPHQIEKMKHLLTCDLNELPLYINTEFKSVVEWRLKQNDHYRTQNPNQVPG